MKFINIRKKFAVLALSLSAIATSFSVPTYAAEIPTATESVQSDVDQPVIVIQRIGDLDVNDALTDNFSARSSKTYVDRVGQIANGQTISGTFKLTNWFGNNFNVIAGAGNTGGSLSFSFVSARYDLPCDGKARVICRETGWSAGTYSYSIYNGTGKTTSYALNIYKP